MNKIPQTAYSAAFWVILVIVSVGNILLLISLGLHLFVRPSPNGEWLITVFAAELLGALILAWRHFFKNDSKEKSPQSKDNVSQYKNTSDPIVKTVGTLESGSTLLCQCPGGHICKHPKLMEQIKHAGFSKFIPSRSYYKEYGSTFYDHINSCNTSLTMVSINLMTGLPFEDLLSQLTNKLTTISTFSIIISLLNPNMSDLMSVMGTILDIKADHLAETIRNALGKMVDHRKDCLSVKNAARFRIRTHNSIPFGSAIIRDHNTESASLQIETKVYKAPINLSFAFELRPGSASGLYETLVAGYTKLISDGQDWLNRT